MTPASAAKFDPARAEAYERQATAGLAGRDAMFRLTASVLTAWLADRTTPHLLCAGVGTGTEVPALAERLPLLRFTAFDPAPAMAAIARGRLAPLASRVTLIEGTLEAVPQGEAFDGATLIGILHHLPGDAARLDLLRGLAERLRPGAPLLLGLMVGRLDETDLLDAWRETLRASDVPESDVAAFCTRFAGEVSLPPDDAAVATLLTTAGFSAPRRYFASLFWTSYVCRRL